MLQFMWRVSYLLSGVDQACHTTGKLVFVILENNWPEQKTPQQEGFARFGHFARAALRPGVNAARFFHGVTRSNDVTSPFTPKKRSPPVWTRPKPVKISTSATSEREQEQCTWQRRALSLSNRTKTVTLAPSYVWITLLFDHVVLHFEFVWQWKTHPFLQNLKQHCQKCWPPGWKYPVAVNGLKHPGTPGDMRDFDISLRFASDVLISLRTRPCVLCRSVLWRVAPWFDSVCDYVSSIARYCFVYVSRELREGIVVTTEDGTPIGLSRVSGSSWQHWSAKPSPKLLLLLLLLLFSTAPR